MSYVYYFQMDKGYQIQVQQYGIVKETKQTLTIRDESGTDDGTMFSYSSDTRAYINAQIAHLCSSIIMFNKMIDYDKEQIRHLTDLL